MCYSFYKYNTLKKNRNVLQNFISIMALCTVEFLHISMIWLKISMTIKEIILTRITIIF